MTIDLHSPDTSLQGDPEPCAHCGCGRRRHHPVQLVDGGTAHMCRGHVLSGGAAGMVQQCGCTDYEPRIVHCEHPRGPLGEPECCCCSLEPCDNALDDRACTFIQHVRASEELQRLHAERSVRYALKHGTREPVPF